MLRITILKMGHSFTHDLFTSILKFKSTFNKSSNSVEESTQCTVYLSKQFITTPSKFIQKQTHLQTT